MNEIVAIIRRSRKHSRVLLDNGHRVLISTVYANVGTFVDPHGMWIPVNNLISSKNEPPVEITKEKPRIIHIVKDCDFFLKETDKNSFIDKCAELETKGYEIISIDTSYRLKQDSPNVFFYAKFSKDKSP